MLAILLVLLQLIVLMALWRLWGRMKSEVQEVQKVQKVQRAPDERSTEIREDAILTEARQSARKMLEEAYLKAGHIVMEGKDFRQGAMKALSDKLEVAAKSELVQFREAMKRAQEESVNSIQNVSKSIESKVSAELMAFHDTLVTETVAGQKQAQAALKRQLAAAEAEVDHYKKELTRELDDDIFKVVAHVIKKVMHEGLSEKEHEALVMEALEEAKKRHLL